MALQHPNMAVAHRQLTTKERQILEKPVLVHIGIVLPDGTPHVSAMWVDLDGEDIILNTAEGRTKANVLRVGSPVALSVLDPENPYRNLGLRGRVVQVISEEQGASAGINRLAKKYLGVEEYPYRPQENDGCSFACGPRSSAVGAKTSLSVSGRTSGVSAEAPNHLARQGYCGQEDSCDLPARSQPRRPSAPLTRGGIMTKAIAL